MDGLTLSHAVQERWPQIRIIVTSVHRATYNGSLPIGGRFYYKPYEPWRVSFFIRNCAVYTRGVSELSACSSTF